MLTQLHYCYCLSRIPLSFLVYRSAVSQTRQTLLILCVKAHTRPNWCNDGERERFPFLPTSWWLCSEVPGGRQFIMCPSPWPCHWRNRQAHVCMNYQPSHLPNPPSHTVEIWHRREKTWGIRVCTSIKVYTHFVHQGLKVLRCAKSPAEKDYSINYIKLNVQ